LMLVVLFLCEHPSQQRLHSKRGQHSAAHSRRIDRRRISDPDSSNPVF
jgi:hypothetical protein